MCVQKLDKCSKSFALIYCIPFSNSVRCDDTFTTANLAQNGELEETKYSNASYDISG